MAQSCIICCRRRSDCHWGFAQTEHDGDGGGGYDCSGTKKAPDANPLQRFFLLLYRYLDDPANGTPDTDNGAAGYKEGMEGLITRKNATATSACCEDCSKVVKSFCHLYNELKTTELQLNWKVWTLTNLFSLASADGEEENDFRKNLVIKCQKKLLSTFPRLALNKHKCHQPQQEQAVMKVELHHQRTKHLKHSGRPKLRHIHQCFICMRTFSDRSKLEGHQRTHEAEGWSVMDSINSEGDGDDDADAAPNYDFDNPLETNSPDPENREEVNPITTPKLEQLVIEPSIKLEPTPDESQDWDQYSEKSYSSNDSNYLDADAKKRSRPRLSLSSASTSVTIKPGSFPCSLCGKEFPRLYTLKRHLRNIHSITDTSAYTSSLSSKATIPDMEVIKKKAVKRNFTIIKTAPSSEEAEQPEPDPETGRYHCAICSKEFTTLQGCQYHYKSFHRIQRFRCNLCHREFPEEGAYRRHHQRIHEVLQFRCAKCGKTFAKKFSLKLHQKGNRCVGSGSSTSGTGAAGLPRKYPCEFCGKRFIQPTHLSKHVKFVHPSPEDAEALRKYPCSFCEKRFTRPEHARRHMKVVHSSLPGYQAMMEAQASKPDPLDDNDDDDAKSEDEASSTGTKIRIKRKRLPFKFNYTILMDPSPLSSEAAQSLHCIVNPSTDKFQCGLCSNEFTHAYGWQGHYKNIHLNRRFKCNLCGQEFTQRGYYVEHHQAVHEGIQFKCPKCDRTFVQKQRLKRHMRADNCTTGTGPLLSGLTRKHQCPLCDHRFVIVAHLERHMKRIHPSSGERATFPCNLCGKNYTRMSHLRRHLTDLHTSEIIQKMEALEEPEAPPQPGPSSSSSVMDPAEDQPTEASTSSSSLPLPPEDVIYKLGGAKKKRSTTNRSFTIVSAADSEEAGTLHWVINPETEKYQCTACAQEFSYTSTCQSHYRKMHLHQRYKCNLCDKVFQLQGSYIRHHKNVHEGVRFDCRGCEKTFKTQFGLSLHERTTSCGGTDPAQIERFLCSQCGRGFLLPSLLRKHIQVAHSETKEHLCDVCGKEFKRKGDMNSHRKKAHREVVGPQEESVSSDAVFY